MKSNGLMTYGYLNQNIKFLDQFNEKKNLLPKLQTMNRYSNDAKIYIPDISQRQNHPDIESKYKEPLQYLCDDIQALDAKITQNYKKPDQTNDASLIQVYVKMLAVQLNRHGFVREYLFQDNDTLKQLIENFIVEPLTNYQYNQQQVLQDEFIRERDKFANQLRFIILGAPLYNQNQLNNEQEAQNRDLFREQMDFVQVIEDDQQNNTLMYLNYYLDGYIKSDEFRKYNKIKQQEMRQMFLHEKLTNSQIQRQRVGLYQTEQDEQALDLEFDNTDIIDQFITRYIPLAKSVNVSDLLFLNGIKITVYYKVIRLFHSMYMRLRSSAPFTNTFNFYQKVPDKRHSDGTEFHRIMVNRNPIILISIILQTVKEYLNIRMKEELNFPETFMKELLFIVLPFQSTVTCQSIGCLYATTINDVRLEPLVMIASLLGKNFSKPNETKYETTTFKLGWSFVKGAYQYLPKLKYINTIIPAEWTSFYTELFDNFNNSQGLLKARAIARIYETSRQRHIEQILNARIRSLENRGLQDTSKTIQIKQFVIRALGFEIPNIEDEEEFDISSLYFEKAYKFLQTKFPHYRPFMNDNWSWNIYQASYLVAGIILDTFILKIQESLNDTVKLLPVNQQVLLEPSEHISSASLQYFSIVQRLETKKKDVREIEYIEFRSMDIMPTVLWLKHCHQSYKPYDIVARDYNISCVIMLVWFSSTKQYQLGLGDSENDRLKIYQNYQIWQTRNLQTIEQCDNIFVNSTKLMTTLKKFLRQENLRVIQIANIQYAMNVNQQKDEYLMLNKNDGSFDEFIVGLYYNHIFMINHFVPIKRFKNTDYNQSTLSSKKNTRSTYKPLINAIVFDIETTQIQIDELSETQSHDMIPYMISSIQYQFTQKTMAVMDQQTLFKQNDDIDFLDMMYQHWLNQITIWDADFYIITFNGCKFDLQFMYKYFVKYHSGCMEIFGTLLSPKYIQISYNNHLIKFIDLYLILGDGSLNKWSEKCGLGKKLDFQPIYNINEFLNLSLEEKQTIVKYCEQDVRLTGSIYYLQCLNMVQMLKDLNVKFNQENAIDVLKPTLASTAYSIFKNGFVDQSIRYINSVDWLTEEKVRQAYNGGFCHCFQLGDIKGDISYFDINSLYPFIMLQEFPLSPPRLEYVNLCLNDISSYIEREKYTHWKITDFQYIEGSKLCLIPQRIHSMNFYFSSGYDLEDCYVPSYVLKLILKDLLFIRIRGALRYHCDFSYIFKDYVSQMYDLRLQAKQRKDELSEKRLKTLMNALYGKTAQSAKLKQDLVSAQHKNAFETSGACAFEYSEYLDAYILDIPVSKDDSLSYLALEIASRSRFYLFQALYQNKKGIIYCDTDSVILNRQPIGIQIDDVKLGHWKDVYKGLNINGLYIYSPKVYEVRYQSMVNGEIIQQSEVKMKGIDKSHINFKENFKVLQNTFEGSFDEQIVWNKQNGFVRQNKISKKLKHRLRRFVEEDGTTRPFMDLKEYENYFKKQLIMKDNKFIYI